MHTIMFAVLLTTCLAMPALKSQKAWVQINVNSNPTTPIIIELDGENAPVTAANFLKLVQNHVYDDTVFHRVVPQFVAQGGDPSQTHSPSGRVQRVNSIPLEIRAVGENSPRYRAPLQGSTPVLHHELGSVAMARTDDPNSASSQFYFVTGPQQNVRHLDGGYAIFGKVVQGMDVVSNIRQGDFIQAIHILDADKVQFDSVEV